MHGHPPFQNVYSRAPWEKKDRDAMLYWLSLFWVVEGQARPAGLPKWVKGRPKKQRQVYPKALTPRLQQRNGAYNNSLVSFSILLIWFYVLGWGQLWAHTWVHVLLEARGAKSPWSDFIANCELHNMGAGNHTWALWKSRLLGSWSESKCIISWLTSVWMRAMSCEVNSHGQWEEGSFCILANHLINANLLRRSWNFPVPSSLSCPSGRKRQRKLALEAIFSPKSFF